MKVLVVDDEPLARERLAAMLGELADTVVVGEASNGRDALDAVARLQPDLVVLDVRMPRLDGIAATARIKTRWPAVRVVVHSLAVERRDDALAAGADAFVPKGATPDELLAALRGPDGVGLRSPA